MQHRLLLTLLLLILLLAGKGFAQSKPVQNKTTSRSSAVPGDTVWVIVNPVKADKRQQFEKFVHEVFWDQATRLSKEEHRAFRQTRILHPTAPEADGTWSYVFIMDPLLKGINYGIEPMLIKMYGETKAQEHLKLLGETMAGEQKRYVTVQSRH
jgi:hypothetical protein